MKITTEEVKHVATLARLRLTEKEIDVMTGQLDEILSYVDKLGELDTSNVAPTTHAISIVNAFREDEVKPSLPHEDALRNGPLRNSDSFIVPRII